MIVQTLCSSFKLDLLQGTQAFGTDTYKMALYVSTATLDATTTAYTTVGEVVGPGYTAGGVVLTGVVTALSGTTAYVNFDNVLWPNSTITARGALIYNHSKSDKAVAVIDFGADKISDNSTFTVVMPAPGATSALIRVP